MGVKKCCVEDCKSCSTRKEDKGVTFHKFPKDTTSRNEWQCITRYKHTLNDIPVYVCSRHFCKGDFQKNEDSKYTLKSDAVPSIFSWTIEQLTMDMSDTEEPLSSIINENEKDPPSSSKALETDNLDAIKKFIEEQEKEILEMELEAKKNQGKISQNYGKKTENDEIKIQSLEEILQDEETEENKIQEAKTLESKFEEKAPFEETKSKNTQESKNINELNKNLGVNHEKNIVSASVMDMILSDSEANIALKEEEHSKDSKHGTEDTTNETSEKISPNDKGNSSISLSVGCKVEVKNFEGEWYAAEVAEVDYDEMEVLVRYEIDLKKTDEWVSVSSPRLRPYTGNTTKPTPPISDPDETSQEDPTLKDNPSKEKPSKDKPLKEITKEVKEEVQEVIKVEDKPKVAFEVGERCLARWRDNRRFCATIHKDLGNGNFEIIFDDGFLWTCSVIRLHKMKPDALTVDTTFQAATAGSPSPIGAGLANAPTSPSPIPAFHTHLFDPTRDYLCSKSERREKKRKLNIKEIFNIGQKKFKKQKTDETPKAVTAPKPVALRKPRILKKNVASKVAKAVQSKEIKTEIPAAVASIIGTVTKELEIKLQPVDFIHEKESKLNTAKTQEQAINEKINDEQPNNEEVNNEEDNNIQQKNEQIDSAADAEMKDEYQMADSMELEGCIVNPNDDTLDDEEVEEPNSEGDPVLEEEIKLENFEKQDSDKHEQVIDKIKEAIIKLEGGINEIEKTNSPKVERMNTPIKGFETPKGLNSPQLKLELEPVSLKEALAEAALNMEIGESSEDVKDIKPELAKVEMVKEPKLKRRDHSKVKKGKKLRQMQEKKVKKQVEKVKSELEQMKKQFEAMRRHMLSEEYVQSPENTPLPESFLFPGEWCCHWVNGQPVGRVSEIEGAPLVGQDNKPGLPRRSVQVEDKRLPPGWTKHMVRRSVGNSAGKWDVVLVSPDRHGNKRFHTKTDMRHFLEAAADDSLAGYERALTDFGVHLKISRRMGWILSTPDGITEGPETILPADTTCNMSPLVKRKTVAEKRRAMKDKRALKIRKDKKRRPIKLKLQRGLHTYNSQLVSGESSGEIKAEPSENVFEQPLMPLEDGYVYVGSLKVQIIENLLRCPADGCFKNFRTKTLLQMHIKHYHRELKAMMGVTPKVLDLAYARQRLPKTDPEQTDKKVIKVKINKPRREEPRPLPSEVESPVTSPPAPVKIEDAPLPKIPRSQDSPKLRQALNHKPVKRPRVLLPVRRPEPEQTIPDSITDGDFESQLLEPTLEIPVLQDQLDFETAISTHTVTKPLEKKKKGDKKKSFALISKTISEDEEWFAMNSDELDTRSSFPRSGSPDSKMDIKMPPMSSESNDDQKDANYTYTDTGERVKIVHMKREEIINCHCGLREEDGLMVQCELCLCWQHALCHNIQRESEVPEKYTCSICVNPRRGRRSRRFLHDQDRLYEGLLPGARPAHHLRRSHELTGNLLRIHDALHALRVKFYVAAKKDHPKLYLWAKEWEQAEITYTQDKLNSDYSDLNIMINGMNKENHPVAHDEGMDIRTPPSEEQDSDRLSARDNQLGSQALLSGLLSSPGGASLELPISTSELERLAKSVQESAEWQRAAAPQPEAAIENGACRERLLRHIQRCHALIDTRLDSIEAQVAELESQDSSFGYESAEFYPRTKQTIQMLMRDLDTMEELGVIT